MTCFTASLVSAASLAALALAIARNLHLVLREHGCPRAALVARTRELLESVGLWREVHDRLEAPALALSGGQQQLHPCSKS
jgi:ABC-type phosphate transport system ATPase subunit